MLENMRPDTNTSIGNSVSLKLTKPGSSILYVLVFFFSLSLGLWIETQSEKRCEWDDKT